MIEGRINLYSDTQTRPCAAMREAMAQAEVGDEQGFLDPSVNALCTRVAALLGKEAAVFLPTGTMCNEIAIAVHCRPGDEIYAHHSAHIINFEGGGPAAIAGAMLRALPGERGMYTPGSLRAAIRDGGRYGPRPALVEVEQTANMGGGSVWPLDRIESVCALARERGLATHLDGARLLNAVVASGVSAASYAAPFDSAWIDLSKGLGCPMGGVLAGSRAFIEHAWRCKQRLGGAMRQAGIIAAAGLYALENNVGRLAEDHRNAENLAQGLRGLDLQAEQHTNMVFVRIPQDKLQPLAAHLEKNAVAVLPGARMRLVTHLDVDAAGIDRALAAFGGFFG